MMTKGDFWKVLTIGGAVGLLVQPILSNTQAVNYLHAFLPIPIGFIRPLIFLAFLVLAPFALWIASLLARVMPVIYQVAKFAAVGSLNSFIDLGIFNLLGLILGVPLGGSVRFGIFKSISFLTATTNSYFWNKLWTFGDSSKSSTQKVLSFYLVTGLNWLINVGVATAVSSVSPDNRLLVSLIAPVCGIFAGMAGNFLGYKFLVFGKKGTETASS